MHFQPEGGPRCAICRLDHRGYWSSHSPNKAKSKKTKAREEARRVGFASREEAHLARTARQTERMRELYEEAVRIEEAERVAREMGRIPRGQVLHDG